MNKQELLELITNGENSYVEFKEEAIKAKDLGEELLRLFEASGSIHYDISAVCFWQVDFQAIRKLIFQAPHFHY